MVVPVLFRHGTRQGRVRQEPARPFEAHLTAGLPKWAIDDATFDRTAAVFDNPDHVAIVIHNYRWRPGLAEGEPKYDAIEERLAQAPAISVPTITMEGDANGAPHPPAAAYAKKFTGRCERRALTGGVGHNLPQAFAQAMLDVFGA